MTHSNDPHAPTDEFVEFLERDTMRRLRYEQRFAQSTNGQKHARRIPSALMLAAGVVMTLTTGMVLGASANYASAEVLPNGTTTIPARPALAILPIKNALSAIGCTQAPQSAAPKAAATVAVAATADSATNQVAAPTVQVKPDRAAIAALATRYEGAVVRGDTAADFVVMVLDASDKYVWSTHGTGGVAIEVGGDQRTPAERREYERAHQKELIGSATLPNEYSYAFFNRDSTDDSLRTMRIYLSGTLNALRYRDTAGSAAGTARGGGGRGGRGGGQVDSLARRYTLHYLRDSSLYGRIVADGNLAWSRQDLLGCAGGIITRGRRAEALAADSVAGPYTVGLPMARFGSHCNQAAGLQQPAAGESGIAGLASGNVTSADVYVFPAVELGSRALQVMVVHLSAGARWTGR